ncbi:MAG: ferritin-like domain-containing protein [Candidatus Sphingomonas colombiensis]|nr:ferritin-like domain-containing protein [Sphingomonas sp.]WEK44243.1 MAG: ferritin-like domain-containing protein [Sphingomonas sp.]
MIDQEKITTVLDAAALRSAERRRFLSLAGRTGAAAGGLALLSACGGNSSSSATPTPTPSPSSTASVEAADISILNLALNLEYLSAQYFSYAAFGTGLPASDLSGPTTPGTVTGGALVPFADPIVAACAREIARDERAHVEFLRSQIGATAVAMPAINIDGGATGAFTTFAQLATVVGAGVPFNPYASDENFLYGAFLLKDVLVTVYKGLTPLIGTPSYVTAASGILGTESYHAGLIRTLLYSKGLTANPGLFSTARDSLDGASTLDKGIAGADATISNIAPVDGNGIVFSRTTGQALNIFFQNKAAVTSGGFFPSGVNGTINMSAASG